MIRLNASSVPLLTRSQKGFSYFLNQSECGRFLYWIAHFKFLVIYDIFTDQKIHIQIKTNGRILNKPEFCFGSVVGDRLCIVSLNLKNLECLNLYTLSVFKIDVTMGLAKLADREYFVSSRFSMFSNRSICQNGNFFLTNQHRNNSLSFQLLNIFNLAEPKHNHLISGVEFWHGIDIFTIDWSTKTAYAFIFHDKIHKFYSIDLKTDQKIGRDFKLCGTEPPEKDVDGPSQWYNGYFYYSRLRRNTISYISKFDPFNMTWKQIDCDQVPNCVHFTITPESTFSIIESYPNSRNKQQLKAHRMALKSPESLKHLCHCTVKNLYPALLKLSKKQQAQRGFLPAYNLEFEAKSRPAQENNYLQVALTLVFASFYFFMFKLLFITVE